MVEIASYGNVRKHSSIPYRVTKSSIGFDIHAIGHGGHGDETERKEEHGFFANRPATDLRSQGGFLPELSWQTELLSF